MYINLHISLNFYLVDFGTSKSWVIRFRITEEELAKLSNVKIIIPSAEYELVRQLSFYRLLCLRDII